MRLPARIGFLLLVLASAAPPASGQYFPFANLGELDGLPSSTVFNLCQDREGLMWFATRGGLVASDGIAWYPRDPLENRPNRVFTHLQTDDQGRIWSLTARPPVQVACLEGDQWRLLPPLKLPGVGWQVSDFAVGENREGTTLVALFSARGYLRVWDGQIWREPVPPQALAGIHTLRFDRGTLLIAAETGLKRLDLGTWELQDDPLPGVPAGPVLTLARERGEDPAYLVVGKNWIGRHRDGRFALLSDDQPFPLKQASGPVFSLVDRTGDLFFGDLSRTYVFSPTRRDLVPIRRAQSRIAEGSNALFEDREGFIWFAGMRGVDKLITRKFMSYDDQHGLFQDEVSAILFRKNGQVILGHEEGLTFLDQETSPLRIEAPPNTRTRVFCLREDSRGDVWLAADQMGVGRLGPDRRLTWWGPDQGLTGGVFALHFDGSGRLWAGTQDGLFRLDGNRFERLVLPGHEIGDLALVRRLIGGPDGEVLVVAAYEGIFRFAEGHEELWIPRQGPDVTFFAVAPTGDGDFWLATSRGLHRVGPDGLPATNDAPCPEISRPIYSILQDAAGRFWFGTDAGVVLWDGQTQRSLTARDGLLGSDTNREALKADEFGRIWIGTERGLSIYSPENDLAPAAPPRLEFTGFEADGQALDAARPLRLESPPQTLFASYRGISFADHRNLGISTWLEGFQPDWQRPAPWTDREVRFHNLPPGTYRFHVRAVLASGEPGPEQVSPPLVIAKPYHARWWFLLICLLAGLFFVWINFTWFTHRRYARKLETEVALRTRDLARSEETVRAESERFAATVNGVSEGVLTLDPDGRVILCNPSARSILGRNAADLLGLTQQEILGGHALQPATFSRAFSHTSPSGRVVWLEGTAAPINGPDGQQAGQVVVLRDVTEKLQREDDLARAQKLESLGLLAGGLAHDFNNLLTIILGNIELAGENGPLPESTRKFLATSRTATFRAKSLTDQLLTFSRGGAPRLAPTSLAEVLRQAADLAFSGSAHTVAFDLADDLWPVHADSGQMVQVFSNLFLNACQAMPSGGLVQVTALNRQGTADDPQPGPGVLVEVRDQGTGISPENQPKIFDPYFTTREKGTGLGLATAYSIAHRHGGSLTFATVPGQGSTFRLFLPRAEEAIPAEPQETALPLRDGQRILVMDDEEPIRSLVQAMLGRMGLEVTTTADGLAAVAAFQAARQEGKPFAAALFDLTVPGGMGGQEAAAILLGRDPEFRIALITGYSTEGILAEHRQHGFRAALTKPFAYPDLEILMGKLLSGS